MEALKSSPTVAYTRDENIDNNAVLHVKESIGQYYDIYGKVYIYYNDTSELHTLGLIHFEDPSHLNMVEQYLFSKSFFIVIRKNRATGEIVDYKHAFDIKKRCYLNDGNDLEKIYRTILWEKQKESKGKNNRIIDNIGKVLDYFSPFK